MNQTLAVENMTTTQVVFPFSSPKEHYKADASIVWCFDDRFTEAREAFIKHRGFTHVDRIIVSGGVQSLTDENDVGYASTIRDIRRSLTLHHSPRIIIMTHSDCGVYGGLVAFGGDQAAEQAKHAPDLLEAASAIRRNFPNDSFEIEALFIDFEGIKKFT